MLVWRGAAKPVLLASPCLLKMWQGFPPLTRINAIRLPQYNASRIGHIVALGAQQCVRELQRQVPQGEAAEELCGHSGVTNCSLLL